MALTLEALAAALAIQAPSLYEENMVKSLVLNLSGTQCRGESCMAGELGTGVRR